jgi:hypothetical protein
MIPDIIRCAARRDGGNAGSNDGIAGGTSRLDIDGTALDSVDDPPAGQDIQEAAAVDDNPRTRLAC